MLSKRKDDELDVNYKKLQRFLGEDYQDNDYLKRAIFFEHIKKGNMAAILELYNQYKYQEDRNHFLLNHPLPPYFSIFCESWLWHESERKEKTADWEKEAKKVAQIYASKHPHPFPLQWAILCEQFEIALSLIEKGADLKYKSLDRFNDSPPESVLFLLINKPKTILGARIFFTIIMREYNINPEKSADNTNHTTLLSSLSTQLTKKAVQDTYLPELLIHAMMKNNTAIIKEILQMKPKIHNLYRILEMYSKCLKEFLEKKYENRDSYHQWRGINDDRSTYYDNFSKHIDNLDIPILQNESIKLFIKKESSLAEKFPDSNTSLDILLKTWAVLLYGETSSYENITIQNPNGVDQLDVAQRNLHILFRSFLEDGDDQAFILVYQSYNGGHPEQNPLIAVMAEILLYHAEAEIKIGNQTVPFLTAKQQAIGGCLIKNLQKPNFTALESKLFEFNRLQHLEVKELRQDVGSLRETVAQLSMAMAEQNEMLKKITGLLIEKAAEKRESYLPKFSLLGQPLTKAKEQATQETEAFKL